MSSRLRSVSLSGLRFQRLSLLSWPISFFLLFRCFLRTPGTWRVVSSFSARGRPIKPFTTPLSKQRRMVLHRSKSSSADKHRRCVHGLGIVSAKGTDFVYSIDGSVSTFSSLDCRCISWSNVDTSPYDCAYELQCLPWQERNQSSNERGTANSAENRLASNLPKIVCKGANGSTGRHSAARSARAGNRLLCTRTERNHWDSIYIYISSILTIRHDFAFIAPVAAQE